MSLEALIERVEIAGYRVNNLFHLNTMWQANLFGSTPDTAYAFGHGTTAYAALERAFETAEAARKKPRDIFD